MKKNNLQSLIISSLTLNIPFFKKVLASNCILCTNHSVYEIHNRKIKASQHSNYVAYWNAQTNPASKIKAARLTVSFMLNTKIKKTDYKCMISLFFYHCTYKLQKLVLRCFSCM